MSALKRQQGLTLVELMIATALSLTLLAGVLLVFSANKATYNLQNGLSVLQENGRYAIQQIASDIQLAGYGGCISPRVSPAPRIINLVSTNAPKTDFLDGFPDQTFFQGRDDETGGFEYDSGAGTPTPMYDGLSGAGTDSLQIRGPLDRKLDYVSGAVITSGTVDVQGFSDTFEVGDYVAISDCAGVDIFAVSGVGGGGTTLAHAAGGAANSQANLSRGFGLDATVSKLVSRTYFVADTGRDNSSGQDIIALYREDEDPSTKAIELVDGVEDFQIEYGLDTDLDGEIDAFRNGPGAPTMVATDWPNVVAIRVSLLLSSIEAASATSAPYTWFPVQNTPITPDAGDLRVRQEFSALISVRNGILE